MDPSTATAAVTNTIATTTATAAVDTTSATVTEAVAETATHTSLFSLSDATTWILFSFIIFAYIIWSKAGKTIVEKIDSRTARIKKELEDAENLRKEAEKVLEEYKLKQSQIMRESEDIIQKARNYAESLKQQAEEESNRITAVREQAIKERIKRAESNAIQEINNETVSLATRAVKKILEETISKTDSTLIDEAIKQLPKEI